MTAPEFSRIFDIAELTGGEAEVEIAADEDERRALARRFDLVALDRLAAALEIARLGPGLYRVAGRLEAAVVQRCVVTLDPVAAALEAPLAMTFSDAVEEGETAPDAEDGPEPMLPGGRIDLGEAVAQHLALSLDPYPRKSGARLEDLLATAEDARAPGPFDKLARLKDRPG